MQVAAVCYRMSGRGLEFLLVRTGGGRWIFPKGGVEPGLTHAQSAALEALQEAGVHGWIEEMPFAHYQHSKACGDAHGARRTRSKSVLAHLCRVSHLEQPRESKRNPTWFSPEKAKRRLLEDRAPDSGEALAGVVDRAVSRIQRLQTTGNKSKDELQKVPFEAFGWADPRNNQINAALLRYFSIERRHALPAPGARRASGQPL